MKSDEARMRRCAVASRSSPSRTGVSNAPFISRLIAASASGGPAASSLAHSVAFCRCVPTGTTLFTSPIWSASSAPTRRAVIASSLARPSPTSRGRRCVPPRSGRIPHRTSITLSAVSVAATRKSQAIASCSPAPNVGPATAAIVGCVIVSKIVNASCNDPMSIDDGLPLLPDVKTEVSMPLEKFGPSPVTTTARTARSEPARAPASARPANTSISIALRTSGRAIVIVATEPDTSYRTFSPIGLLLFVFFPSSSPWPRLRNGGPLDRVTTEPFAQPIHRAIGRSPAIGPLADAELLRTRACYEAARRDTEKPDARPMETKHRVQVARRCVDLRRTVGRRRQRTRARDRFEIGEANLDRHRAGGVAAAAQTLRDAIGKPQELAADVLERVEVTFERLLGRDLLRRFVRHDGAIVFAFRKRKEMGRGAVTESTLEHAVGQRDDVPNRLHAETAERRSGLLADPPQRVAGQRIQELVDVAGGYMHDAVGLRVLAREFGEELVRRDTDRARERALRSHARADFLCDRNRLAEQTHGSADVEERFVERDLLYERREGEQDLKDQFGLCAV